MSHFGVSSLRNATCKTKIIVAYIRPGLTLTLSHNTRDILFIPALHKF